MNDPSWEQKNVLISNAKNLLQWNSKNLVSNSELKKSELSRFFAEKFQVFANGFKHHANYDNYYDFLNVFRAEIKTIDYILQDFIVDEFHVVIPLTANIQRINNCKQIFDAILILKFNEAGKIILWHEVYVEVKSS